MGTQDTELSAAKQVARAEARHRRRAADRLDDEGLADQALALVEQTAGPRRVTCYASYGTEPDTCALRERLASAGFEVLLPRVRGEDLEWVVDDGDAVVSSMGIDEPVGPAVDLLPARVMLVPALAVTPDGDRLGKGGGFYDRVLSRLSGTSPLIAAVVGDADVVAHVPVDSHDQRVHAIVTPTRVIRCAAR